MAGYLRAWSIEGPPLARSGAAEAALETPEPAQHRDPQVQVIFLTFYGDAFWDGAVKEADAFCFLVNGCPPAMIIEMIHKAHSHRRHADRRGLSAAG